MTVDFPCNSPLLLPGPVGALEVLTACPVDPLATTAIICHPNSRDGGTMHNKVVHTLARAFGDLGARTVRFNFRGVGASVGEYTQGPGETEDALAVLAWVRSVRPNDEIWLAGFSFGGFVALCAAERFPVTRLILVAPAVGVYRELGPPPEPRVPLLILQGEEDDITPAADLKKWIDRLESKPTVREFPEVGHFFHGRLNDLRVAVQEEIGPQLRRE
ncbi:MAG: alpha/beta fold hydrolase [Gammaproteobacteria bacterium]|nr:alpha/beta fold hydrolase [Gammaproteobacteria bacterium]